MQAQQPGDSQPDARPQGNVQSRNHQQMGQPHLPEVGLHLRSQVGVIPHSHSGGDAAQIGPEIPPKGLGQLGAQSRYPGCHALAAPRHLQIAALPFEKHAVSPFGSCKGIFL